MPNPAIAPPKQAPIGHEQMITDRLRELDGYSPIRIETAIADIDGARYEQIRYGDSAGLLVARLGGSALRIEEDGDNLRVVAQVGPGAPTILEPEDIRSVQADHPYGQDMPLNGRRLPSAWPVAPPYPGTATFAWAPKFIEYDHHDYFVTKRHPEFPGISEIKAYNAQSRNWRDGTNPDRDIPSLEEAIAADKTPITHFISKTALNRGWGSDRQEMPDYVVTSCCQLDSKEGHGVIIRQPQYPENDRSEPLRIDMFDMPRGTTEEALLKAHIARWYGMSTERYTHHPTTPMSQFEADQVYLYMAAD